jgi:hypothetical protein
MITYGISTGFPVLSPTSGQVAHVLLTRSPLGTPLPYGRKALARLACVRHAASVNPEPGSNSPSKRRPKAFALSPKTLKSFPLFSCQSTDRPAPPASDGPMGTPDPDGEGITVIVSPERASLQVAGAIPNLSICHLARRQAGPPGPTRNHTLNPRALLGRVEWALQDIPTTPAGRPGPGPGSARRRIPGRRRPGARGRAG